MFVEVHRRRLLQAFALGVIGPSALGQGAPARLGTRDITLVVPAEPGGGLDAAARTLARGLASIVPNTVVVLNRSGGSGTLGAGLVARAEPDGHTVLINGVGHMVAPLMHPDSGLDPIRDFTPLAQLATAPNVLLVHESLKDLSLAQLIRDPRSRNEGLAFASAGYGNTSHLAGEVFMAQTGCRWLHVPYRGTSPALRALMAGDVQLMFAPASSLSTALGNGRVHALAVGQAQRLPQWPAIRTLAEQGVKNADFAQWYGLFGPAGLSTTMADQWSEWVLAAMKDPALLRQFEQHGVEPSVSGRREFTRFIASEHARLVGLVRKEQIKPAVN